MICQVIKTLKISGFRSPQDRHLNKSHHCDKSTKKRTYLLPYAGLSRKAGMKMNYDNKSTGMRIKHFRNLKKLSQEQLAEKLGVSQEHLARIETGNKIPSLELFVSIANMLETSADHLLSDSLIVLRSEDEKEYYTIFSDCTNDEREMLLRMLKFLKALLSEYGI